jgi:hypothetical protein
MPTDAEKEAIALITPLTDEPNAIEINTFMQQLVEVATNLATRTQTPGGHVGVLLDAPTYAALFNGAVYIAPINPGNQPAIVGGTAVQIADAARAFKDQLDDAKLDHNATTLLRNLILQKVPHHLLSEIAHPVFRFANVTPRAMLSHLRTEYATMTADEAEANRASLTAPINIDEPLTTLWTKLSMVQHAAPVFAPITAITAITLTLKQFKATGVFTKAVDSWTEKPAADHTMANFRTHFNKANKDRRLDLTTGAAGLHGANAATSSTTGTAPTANSNTRTGANNPHVHPTQGGKKMAYCYTHGASINLSHTSATCAKRCEGHKEAATMDNMMGGCNLINDGSRGARRSAQN